MERRRFGNTDLTTSPIGFGTWEMSGTMYGEIDAAAASRAVGAAGWKLSDEIRAQVDRIFAAENVPTYAGAPVMVRPDQRILSEGDD